MKGRIAKLSSDHWTKYVVGLILVHSDVTRMYTHAEMMAIAEFHYISATIHGYGHGVEDERDGLFARLPPDFTLPSITVEGNASVHHAKYLEESREWNEAEAGSMAETIELWDVLQAAQTWAEHSFEAHTHTMPHATAIREAQRVLNVYYAEGRDIMQAKRIMLIKNAGRSRYSRQDNARILDLV